MKTSEDVELEEFRRKYPIGGGSSNAHLYVFMVWLCIMFLFGGKIFGE